MLKEQGYLFLYSGQAKRIIQHLEQAEVYDQQAIELAQQVDKDTPLAFCEVRKIIQSEEDAEIDCLSFTATPTPELEDQSRLAFWAIRKSA